MANPGDSSGFRCGGRMFAASEIALICEVVATCRGLSRKERANTISELVGWTRANGSLKEPECLMLLARLEAQGLLRLPANSRGDRSDQSLRFRTRPRANRACR